MSISYVITITKREFCEEYLNYFEKSKTAFTLCALCHGTAQQKMLDYLGIEKTEKVILFAAFDQTNAKQVLKNLVHKMQIDIPGNGIAMTVPLESIGGAGALQTMLSDYQPEVGGKEEMGEFQYSLIITVTDKGNTDSIMEAAREANAGGGTVIHAKGTGAEYAKKFFGMSIAEEKEMILIVAKHNDRDTIMKAIMNRSKQNPENRTIVFSLPVDKVVGLRSLTEQEDQL